MFSQASVKNSVGGGHLWWGVCMVGGMHGGGGGMCARGACMAGGGGHVWQERRPLQLTVHILLEFIIVFQFISVADPGFPEGGAPTTEFGTTTYCLTIFFAENCMQMKEIGPRGGYFTGIQF